MPARYKIDPEMTLSDGTDTWHETCEEHEADCWAVYEVTGKDGNEVDFFIEEFPTRKDAESYVAMRKSPDNDSKYGCRSI